MSSARSRVAAARSARSRGRTAARVAALIGAGAAVIALRRRSAQTLAPDADRSSAAVGLESQVRSRAGVSGTVQLAPPSWEPAALSALAQWVPQAPQTPLRRAAAYLWASPLTLAGLLAGAATGARPELRHGVVLFRNAGGLTGKVLRRRGFAAGALGHVILAVGDPSPVLLTHELTHVRQAERLGPAMAIVYPGLLAVYGYARHPMERAARRAARLASQRS
ncbi:MAG TPA: hypothetical protein VML96_01730 [Egibacteraceae bacterium]|nr:hypothetical protein [Egibacteraceae bacterium]